MIWFKLYILYCDPLSNLKDLKEINVKIIINILDDSTWYMKNRLLICSTCCGVLDSDYNHFFFKCSKTFDSLTHLKYRLYYSKHHLYSIILIINFAKRVFKDSKTKKKKRKTIGWKTCYFRTCKQRSKLFSTPLQRKI